METDTEKIYALLVKLNEKMDKQNNVLLEIRDLLKKHTEIPHEPKKIPVITTQPLGGVFAE